MNNYLKLITPTNIAEERIKFLADIHYAPQFHYAWSAVPESKLPEELLKLLEILIAQDPTTITKAGQDFFDVQILDSDILYAQELIKTIPERQPITAYGYAEYAIQKFKEYGIDYKVEIVDKHGFQGRPDHKNHILRLSKYLKSDHYSIEGLVKHELVHIIRAINGESNNIPPQKGYLGTDEGLAAYIQDNQFNGLSGSLFQHAIEYLASIVAREHGFYEVYSFMINHGFDPEVAWLRSIRQKFGLCDTSQPGSLMKAGMQFAHERLMQQLTPDKIERLFVGKIRLDQIPNYNAYSGKVDLEIIREITKINQ